MLRFIPKDRNYNEWEIENNTTDTLCLDHDLSKLCAGVPTVPLTDKQYSSIADSKTKVGDENACNWAAAMGGPELLNAQKQMVKDRDAFMSALNSSYAQVQSINSNSSEMNANNDKLKNEIEGKILKLEDDNSSLNKMVELRDTIIGQNETAELTKNSSKMQVVLWSCIGVGLLLYTMFAVGTEDSFSGMNLVLLIICAIIFFVLARNMYLGRKTLHID